MIAHIGLRCAATEGLLLLGSDECDRGSVGVETKNDPKVAGYWWDPMSPRPFFSLTPVESEWPLFFGIFAWNQDSTVDLGPMGA